MRRVYLFAYRAFSWLADCLCPLRGAALETLALANWQASPTYAGHAVLVYCATLGEFRAIAPLVDVLQEQRPQLRPVYILGDAQYAQTLSKEAPEATILRPPGPLLSRVQELFFRYRPVLVIYAEGPALHGRFPLVLDLSIAASCLRSGTPLIVANACLYEESLPSRIDRLEHSLFASLHCEAVTHWFCGHKVFADQLTELGVAQSRISITGDLKFDAAQRLLAPSTSHDTGKYVAMIRQDDTPTIVAGCVNAVDELQSVIEAWESVNARGVKCRLVVAPRYLNNAEAMAKLFTWFNNHGLTPTRRSEMVDVPVLAPLTLLDTFGELSYVYQAATVAYAGRNHGVLEPLVAGVPTIVASDDNWRKDNSSYPLYHALSTTGALRRLSKDEPLADAFMQLLGDSTIRAEYRARISAALTANRGAAGRVVNALIARKLI